ncbi:MAG TPA: hypothetical protein VEA69_04350 [Tepidisphaeraceae bacterium]|nr:hypothetical protein [Tepidisphaeraceae bacterium]
MSNLPLERTAAKTERIGPRPGLKVLGIFGLLLVVAIVTASVTPVFAKTENIESLFRRTSLFAIFGIGVAFVIITGGIDLSIGSVVALVGCLLPILIYPKFAAVDQTTILEMTEGNNYMLVDGDYSRFKPGDAIHLTPESGTDKQVLTIGKVDFEPSNTSFTGNARPITAIEFTTANKTTVSVGWATRVQRLVEFKPDEAALTLRGTPGAALPAKYDRVTLISADGTGSRSFPVNSAEQQGDLVRLTLGGDRGAIVDAAKGSPKAFVSFERHSRLMSIPMAVAALLALSALLGLGHGLLITKLKLQPFIVTLCGLLIYRGVIRGIANDQTQGFGIVFDDLRFLATGKAFSIPVPFLGWLSERSMSAPLFTWVAVPMPFLIMAVIAVIAAVVLNRTIFGRYLKALGRNEQAARYSGINTDRTVIAAYMICSLLAGIGGMLELLNVNSGQPSDFGNAYELYAIAAAVLGGCSLRGGEGSILGVVIGAALLIVLYNSILLLGMPTRMEFAIIGSVILMGVIADELVRRVAAKRRATRTAGA